MVYAMESFEEATVYLLRVARVTAAQLFALGGPALILIYLTSKLSGCVHRMAYRAMGRSIYLLLFGWVGTTVHETAHALTALLFGHRVVSFRPFAPTAKAGVLGNICTKYNEGNLYSHFGLFFIGIAPVVFGTLVMFLALYALFRDQMYLVMDRVATEDFTIGSMIGDVLSSALAFVAFVFSPRHLLDWRLYLFLYIAFAVGSSIQLSDADIKGARPGCVTFIVLLFLFNLVLVGVGGSSESTFDWLIRYYTIFYIILFFAILLDLLAIVILWLPAAIGA